MADRKETIIIDVQVTSAKLAETVKGIADLKNENKELQKQIRSGSGDVAAAAQKLAENQAMVKSLTAAEKELTGQIAITTAANRKYGDSNDALRAQVIDLERQYNSLSKEQKNTEAGRALLAQQNELKASVKANAEELGNFQDEVGNYEKASISLRAELKQIVTQMAQMKIAGQQNTEEYRNLQERGGELKDALTDVALELKNVGSDTRGIDQVVGAFQALGAAAQVAEGAQALLGSESEAVQESIQKMVAIQSVLNGVQEIGNALQKESAFMLGIKTVKQKALAAWTIILTNLERIFGVTSATAMALATAGITLLITGIILLIANFNKIIAGLKAFFGIADKFQQTKKDIEANTKALEGFSEKTNLLTERLKSEGKTEQEILDFKKKRFKEELSLNRKLYKDLSKLGKDATVDQKEQLKTAALFIRNSAAEEYKLNTEQISLTSKLKSDGLKKDEDNNKKYNESIKNARAKEISNMETDFKIEQEKTKLSGQQIFEGEKKILDKKLQYGIISQKEYELAILQIKKTAAEDDLRLKKEAADATVAQLDYELSIRKLKEQERLAGQVLTDEELKANRDAANLDEYNANLKKLELQKTDEATFLQDKALLDQQFKTNKAVSDAEFEVQQAEKKKTAAATDLQNEMAIAEMQHQSLFDLRSEQLDADYQAEIENAKKTGADTFLIEQKYTEAKKQLAFEEQQAKLDLASGLAGNLATIFGENTKIGKAAAAAQIAIDTYKGAMSAYSALAAYPPLAIAAAAAVGVVGAKKIKDIYTVKEKFAGGGIVGGSSFSGDNVRVGVNSGEMILNGSQQRNLFEAIAKNNISSTGGIDYDLLARAMSRQPAPVLSYKEFSEFREKIVTFDEHTKI